MRFPDQSGAAIWHEPADDVARVFEAIERSKGDLAAYQGIIQRTEKTVRETLALVEESKALLARYNSGS